jgi:putative phage-type endonuclease
MPFTTEELRERQKFIGASEASAALGMSPFFSAVDLYLSKIGEGEPIDETIPMMVGTALEPVAIALFERETQLKVGMRQERFYSGSVPWRRATVDGIAEDGWIVEAKTSGDYRGWGDGEDEVPQHYLFNAAHSMVCAPDAPGVYFPVLIGGRTYRTYRVPRDEELIGLVCEGEAQFWKHVQQRIPPEPKSMYDLKRLYPKSLGTEVIATPEVEAAAKRIAHAKAHIKVQQEVLDADMLTVCKHMGSAGTVRRISLTGTAGAVLATWSSQERRTIDADWLRSNYPVIAKEATKVSTSRVYLNKIK